MLNSGPSQSVEGGSVAIQATRDVTINNGLSYSDVRDICTAFWQDNFPILREEARKTAAASVNDFAELLGKALLSPDKPLALDRLNAPDVQATLVDAVQAVARRGKAANPFLLTKLIAERIAIQPNEYKDLVLGEAVKVIPSLTSAQIAFLSFHHFIYSKEFVSGITLDALEERARLAIKFCEPGFLLSVSQRQHLQYVGVTATNGQTFRYDIMYDKRTHHDKLIGWVNRDAESFLKQLAEHAPILLSLYKQFDTDYLGAVHLTSVGQAIAIANISMYIDNFGYSIWLV